MEIEEDFGGISGGSSFMCEDLIKNGSIASKIADGALTLCLALTIVLQGIKLICESCQAIYVRLRLAGCQT